MYPYLEQEPWSKGNSGCWFFSMGIVNSTMIMGFPMGIVRIAMILVFPWELLVTNRDGTYKSLERKF